MASRQWPAVLVPLLGLVLVVVALGWWFRPGPTRSAAEPAVDVAPAAGSSAAPAGRPAAEDSPFATVDTADPSGQAVAGEPAPAAGGAPVSADTPPRTPEAMLGRRGLTDEELQAVVRRLQTDPQFRGRVLAEFREARDPERLRRLAMVLGRAGGDGLTETASAMVYGSEPAARRAGLDLLGRIQVSDPAARAVIVDLLAAETDERLLVDTLNALAVASADGDAALVPQTLALTAHPSAAVRGSTVAILSRWADDATLAPVLEQGLLDEDSRVRGASVFALVNGPEMSLSMRENLFAIAENDDESREVRSGALLALQGEPLDAAERQRLQAAFTAFNTRSAPSDP